MRKISILSLLSLAACTTTTTTQTPSLTPLHVEYSVAMTETGDTICFGGYGSSMAFDRQDSSYYLLTDRGPNVDGKSPESKMFPFPEFSPTIGRFKVEGDSLILQEAIILKDSDGTPFLGLPNREGDGVTGEVAYDIHGNVISSNYRGLDSEGLAIAPDGTFWVSDEYAPFVMQFDRSGKLLREMTPGNGFPAYFAKRRPNRGMEGLTISADGTKLYGIMQSPLYIPDSSTKNRSINNRILEIDLTSGATREFIYQLESPDLAVSEITFVDDSTMLVLERDGKFASKGVVPFKRVYKINIASATDVSNTEIEMLSNEQLAEQSISPVTKELAVDIIKEIPDYGHDKAEGIVIMENNILAIVNDDDFSAFETNDGGFRPKVNPKGEVDHSVVYFVEMK